MKLPNWIIGAGVVAVGLLAFVIPVAIAAAVVFGLTALVWFTWNTILAPCIGGPQFGFWSVFLILTALRVLALFVRGK